jgi:hypothetical protein
MASGRKLKTGAIASGKKKPDRESAGRAGYSAPWEIGSLQV